jgi:hypothetical protein
MVDFKQFFYIASGGGLTKEASGPTCDRELNEVTKDE